MGVTGGIPPPTTYMKIWLILPQIGMWPPLFCHQNSVVAIFMQFLVILVKIAPPPREPLQEIVLYIDIYVYFDFLEDNKSF